MSLAADITAPLCCGSVSGRMVKMLVATVKSEGDVKRDFLLWIFRTKERVLNKYTGNKIPVVRELFIFRISTSKTTIVQK